MEADPVHLVYIHGFQGDDTTFQSFPKDLQEYLAEHISPKVNRTFRTSLYPTYRSVKPISHATRNFLQWLATQPPGPVILLGHSMGGLLAAEAATDEANYDAQGQYPGAKPRRIVGMMAFDTPYLGMHPHVVISGIASLFAKEDDKKSGKTEKELNTHPEVEFVDQHATDDWDSFKKGTEKGQSTNSLSVRSPSPVPRTPSPLSKYGIPPSPMVDKAMSFVQTHQNDPLVRWARKHADDPFSSGKRWVIEHFQFGSCMFDPIGLKDRYKRLVGWQGGLWINYWTQTLPPRQVTDDPESLQPTSSEQNLENDLALLENGIADNLSITTASSRTTSTYPESILSSTNDPLEGPKTKSEVKSDEKATAKAQKTEEKARQKEQKEKVKQLKQLQKEREKAGKAKAKPPAGNHFIVLPTGLAKVLGGYDKWEKVLIEGVEDEVGAHCGLFIRGENLDYDGLVERVGHRIMNWCQRI